MLKSGVKIVLVLVVFVGWFLANEYEQGGFRVTLMFIPVLWLSVLLYSYKKRLLLGLVLPYLFFLLTIKATVVNFSSASGSVQMHSLLVSLLLATLLRCIVSSKYVSMPAIRAGLTWLLFQLFSIPSLAYLLYYYNFDTRVTRDVFFALSQTNVTETFEFISGYISTIIISAVVIYGVLTLVGLYIQVKMVRVTGSIKFNLIAISILAVLSIATFNGNRLIQFAMKAKSEYLGELEAFKKLQDKIENREIRVDAVKEGGGETYLIVIGESLHKRHMGVYGYVRETTPRLSKLKSNGELLVLNNAISSHVHTMQVLSHSLTEASQLNGKNYFNSASILDIVKAAGFETYWVTNQILFGGYDNLVSVVAHKSDSIIALNRTVGKDQHAQVFDGALVKEVRGILEKPTLNNRVVFVQLMGSHSQYCKRFPKDQFSLFDGELDKSLFGKFLERDQKERGQNSINCYDNSVLYNDFVVTELLDELKNLDQISGFVYMADHADDVLSGKGHNSGNFTFPMTEIPFMFWLSDKYDKKYSSVKSNILRHQNALITNDYFYDISIGLMNIETDRYEVNHDVTTDLFQQLPYDSVFTLLGGKNIADSLNTHYWGRENAEFLKDKGQEQRVFPHRVNSIGKLKEVLEDGFRSVEIDVIYNVTTGKFNVGHSLENVGKTLEEYFTYLSSENWKKVWLDIKNLNEDNYVQLLNRLRILDSMFNIKKKVLFESDTKALFIRTLSVEGWHTSYYLPTGELLTLVEDNNNVALKEKAKEIIVQVSSQGVKALSFDTKLYGFVKEYIEPGLPLNIVYHTWYGPQINHKDFKNNLLKDSIYKDARVHTVLCVYSSYFDL